MLTPIAPALQIFVVLVATLAAITDLRTRRIPNALVLSAALAGFAAQVLLLGLPGLRSAGLGFGLGFILYFPLWLLHARGAGDVKLLAALGTFWGPGNTFALFIVAAVVGGVLALFMVLFKGRVRETAGNVGTILTDLLRLRMPAASVHDERALRLPHAPVLALASFAILIILNTV